MDNHGTRWDRGFKAEKALAAIGYIVTNCDADLYSVMKMLYLADKAHLSKYGRSVTGDDFTAMEKGPVPEGAYALCKYVSGRRAYFDPLPDARDRLAMDGHRFQFLQEPDLDALSVSDTRALDEAISLFEGGGWKAVADASHDDAWRAAWAEAVARGTGSIPIAPATIISTLPNGPALLEYLADPHPELEPTDLCEVETDG